MSTAIIVATKAASPAIRHLLDRVVRKGLDDIARTRQEMYEEWIRDVDERTSEQYTYLQMRIADLEERLRPRTEDPTTGRVFANYARAADTEAIDERRCMLAYAAAALIDARLTVAEHARVERVLRELDPLDVQWLNVIHRSLGLRYKQGSPSNGGQLRWLVWADSPSPDVLTASACVRVTYRDPNLLGSAGKDEVDVTREGHMVLRVLRLYLRARPSPVEIPGHEALPDDRSEEEARAVIAGIVGLQENVIRLTSERASLYVVPKPPTPEGPPMPMGTLGIIRVPLTAANALVNLAPRTPEAAIGIDTLTIDGEPETRLVQIHGPHDVLRWLADEIDAVWT